MAFTSVCKTNYLSEGDWAPFIVAGEPIMLVWPEGDRPRAYQGLCPHEDATLESGIFNGRLITCTAHGWVFDSSTGKGLSPPGWELEQYPLRIEDGWIQVDMEMVLE